MIGGKHINQCVLNTDSPDYISWDKYYESPEIMVAFGDIVMAQRGSLGKVAIIDKDINFLSYFKIFNQKTTILKLEHRDHNPRSR